MKTEEFKSESLEQTKQIAASFATRLNQGDVLCMYGDLGAGKTAFVQGLADGMGVDDYVNSPTFTIVNEYTNNKATVYHFDVYRLEDCDEFYAIGGEEYFSKGICIIEWGEIIEEALPQHYIKIDIKKDENDFEKRILCIEEK